MTSENLYGKYRQTFQLEGKILGRFGRDPKWWENYLAVLGFSCLSLLLLVYCRTAASAPFHKRDGQGAVRGNPLGAGGNELNEGGCLPARNMSGSWKEISREMAQYMTKEADKDIFATSKAVQKAFVG